MGDIELDLAPLDSDQRVERFGFTHLGFVEKSEPKSDSKSSIKSSNSSKKKEVIM